jgi:AcrR family transcriptional regulator
MDERSAITEKSIRTAFFQLMQEKGFQKISVSSITGRAGINRTTFYLHYTDKFDLLDKVEDALLAEIGGIMDKALSEIFSPRIAKEKIYRAAVSIMRYIQENRLEFTVLMEQRADSGFSEKYSALVRTIVMSGKLPFDIKAPDYLAALISGAHYNIIRTWVLNDMREPPEVLAELIGSIAQNLMKTLIRLQLRL